MPLDRPALVADLGATNARFALVSSAGVADIRILPCRDFPSLEAAIESYLDQVAPPARPAAAAIAIASPITGDQVTMTNQAWTFSISGMKAQFGLDRLEVVNDFTAAALSVPQLGPGDFRQVGDGKPLPGRAVGVIGPGTGLGVSGLVPTREAWQPLAGEGGHVTMAAVTAREEAVLTWLRQKHRHVSAERVLSGMGLTNLYEAIAALEGEEDAPMRDPPGVTEAGVAGRDPICREAVDMFCGMLGTVAGNLALTIGAFGGIYIAGGIVPKLGPYFDQSPFRERFIDKGRFRSYLDEIPTYVITHPTQAFLGLKLVLERP